MNINKHGHVFFLVVMMLGSSIYYSRYAFDIKIFEYRIFMDAVYISIMTLAIYRIVTLLIKKEDKEEKVNWSTLTKKKLLYTILGVAAYLIVIPRLGFMESTFVFVALLSIGLGAKKYIHPILVSGVFVAAVYLVFSVIIGTKFPAWFIKF